MFMVRGETRTFNELKEDLMGSSKMYFEFIKLDDKPEKGERKMADEMALLIGDMIDDCIEQEEEKEGEESQEEKRYLDLFKICLLENAYETSCYNFDIQISLLKSFDRLGWTASFSESFSNLEIKGV